MNQADFEKKLQAEGYGEMVDRTMEANHFNPEHAHDFDACVFVVEGEITIARRGRPDTFRAGDVCSMAAGTPGRHEPDIGEINYPYLFDLFDEIGYAGWIGCEYRPKTETRAGLGWARHYGIKG